VLDGDAAAHWRASSELTPASHYMPCCIMFHADNIDRVKLQCLFDEHDTDKNGHIGVNELEKLLVKLGVAPLTEVNKLNSASSDKLPKEPVAENEH
jgi:Ca2+-binding EF-hand superfamily protein